MADIVKQGFGKVPEVVLSFWIIKLLATTLGETGGDAVTMSMHLGYATGTVIFAAIFVIAVIGQMRAERFNPYLCWLTIVATTTLGTTMADFADRSLGIGYAGGLFILALLLATSLAVWRWTEGGVSVNRVATPRTATFYWITILFSQTLGTAQGEWMADSNGLGFGGGAVVFGTAIVLIATAYYFTRVSHVMLFWAAFILSRPLGATVGDLLDKPLVQGGLELSRMGASVELIGAMLLLIVALPQRAGPHLAPQQLS